ncbi:hypothetical protein HZZ13_36095 [Bradyrhizobium sp. CNPSo 4010]|uniref:Restriction endonuclease n=1 Tax=Bradyrhizobium agreste TaxID=2751811 RepID=A0ABS0Q118_9BRAD|nr:hypothetical protein [Bradyrhizobium agreste]MBH5403177.1 hypothetical protein [Bradyrhizobium agreste]
MATPPRIWLDYRPVRIGWVVTGQDTSQLATAAGWNTCLWGGRYNCVVPANDEPLADSIVSCFGVDVLIPVEQSDASAAFISRFPHLEYHQWRKGIFAQRGCEFADIRHPVRIVARQEKEPAEFFTAPTWESSDPLKILLTLQFGCYPAPDTNIADYRGAIENALKSSATAIPLDGPLPVALLEQVTPLKLTAYDLSHERSFRGRRGPGVVLGSATDFDALLMFWNLRAAGAPLIFYDQAHSTRLKPYAEAFLSPFRGKRLSPSERVTFWIRRDYSTDDSWKPDLDLSDLPISLSDGRGDIIWNGLNVEPSSPKFSAWHRDVVPSYVEGSGKASASFSLPGRPFNDDDTQALSQKFVVVVDATQHGSPDAELTFETPHVPALNEFYGRNFYFEYDAARSQAGRFDKGSIGIITSISTQRLEIQAFRVFHWLKEFFEISKLKIERSEPGLRCSRIIAQLGGIQSCRVLKVRGARLLLRAYGVDEHFTRSAAITKIRDVDAANSSSSLELFKHLFIEYRESGDLKADDVFRYLLERRVFRAGLEFTCSNCQLPSWTHLDDVKTNISCSYCDHTYDVSPQLKDRDWRYRRSGIFGRNDNQLGGVTVALTLQQLDTSLHDRLMMYSTAIKFTSSTGAIEQCESDLVAVVAGTSLDGDSSVEIAFGECKTEMPFNEEDVRKLRALADAIPSTLAVTYIIFSKTGTFSDAELALAKSLNSEYRKRVILWSRDELEPYHVYERSKDRLGDDWHASSLADMAQITHRLYFTNAAASSSQVQGGS